MELFSSEFSFDYFGSGLLKVEFGFVIGRVGGFMVEV